MANMKILDRCEQATMRIGKILHIGGMVADGESNEKLRDFVEYQLDELARQDMAAQLPWLARFDEDPCVEQFVEAAIDHKTVGFLIRAEHPDVQVKDICSDGTGFRCSWSCYRARWFYAESFGAAVLLAERWAKSNIQAVKKAAMAERKLAKSKAVANA